MRLSEAQDDESRCVVNVVWGLLIFEKRDGPLARFMSSRIWR